MTIYTVGSKEFFKVSDAKKEMKATGLPGFKTKVYSNGDWIFCGEISLNKNNKCQVVGDKDCNSY